ncbi:acyltransferase family protein [Paenibacillus sp. GCM10027628]|uniref:acyltransferase family protein n=1 Tax=Paenibacillus sp. GCM10027628 TaxID=3273413 RepID=UPI0036427F30
MEKQHQDPATTFMLNAKFLLILLVVVANSIEPLIDQSETFHTFYLWIYTFHIPMFALVMGYFSKHFRFNRQGFESLTEIVYQYFIFQSLYSLMDALFFHVPGTRHSFFIPYSLVWFLLSHLCWKLLLPLFASLRRPFLVSILIGIIIGYLPFTGAWLSFSRTFVFFPFFLAGYYFRFDIHQRTFMQLFKGISIVLTAVVAVFLYIIPINPKWLYSSYTFLELGTSGWYAGLYRIGIYVLEAIASLCFLSLVPAVSSKLTDWGKYTVYVFLLQGFIIKGAIAVGLFAHVNKGWHSAIVLLFAVALTCLLSQSWVRKVCRPLIEPKLTFLNRFIMKKSTSIRR